MVTTSLIAVVGLICAAALAVGFGFVVPVSEPYPVEKRPGPTASDSPKRTLAARRGG